MNYFPVSHWLERLRRGWRWCARCGLPKVHQFSGPIPHCPDCRESAREDTFCTECGTEIDRSTREWFRKHKPFPARKCWYCSRGYTQPHLVHGVKCPAEWSDPGMIVYRSSSVPARP